MPCCNGCKYKAIVDTMVETMPGLKDLIERNDTKALREELDRMWRLSG